MGSTPTSASPYAATVCVEEAKAVFGVEAPKKLQVLPAKTIERLANGATWALALFLVLDSASFVLDRGHRPVHYLAAEELLYGISPRVAASVPTFGMFLRITGIATVAAVVVAATTRIASRGRWRMKATQHFAILLLSAVLGALVTLVLRRQ